MGWLLLLREFGTLKPAKKREPAGRPTGSLFKKAAAPRARGRALRGKVKPGGARPLAIFYVPQGTAATGPVPFRAPQKPPDKQKRGRFYDQDRTFHSLR